MIEPWVFYLIIDTHKGKESSGPVVFLIWYREKLDYLQVQA